MIGGCVVPSFRKAGGVNACAVNVNVQSLLDELASAEHEERRRRRCPW